jgi:hypothetical protein
MAKPTPFLAAVAWGFVPGPAFNELAEKLFKRKLNRELKPHRIYIESDRKFWTNVPGGSRETRAWQLVAWREKREICSGTLAAVARHAYHRIHGGDDAGVG